MDQIKIGKFISKCRKKQNLTQEQLAEMLGISDRAISKWENGNCMPDASNIPELCKILNITINDLFSGEIVDTKDNNKKLEENLLEIKKQKEDSDKRLLLTEIVMGISTIIVYLILVMIASYADMPDIIRILIIVTSTIFVFIICFISLRIEQTAGYYKCTKCNHKYIPTYKSVLWAMHMGRTRYMKCPKCGMKSWNKKILTK